MEELSYLDLDGKKLAIVDPVASQKISALEEEVKKIKEENPEVSSHTHDNATQSESGFMSPEDKKKLDGIDENANNYTLPAASSTVRGGVKTGYEQNNKKYPVELEDEKMYVEVPWQNDNTTYEEATQTNAGLMSPDDKKNLDNYTNTLGNVTGKTDSLEVDSSEVLVTSKALKKVSDSLGEDENGMTVHEKLDYLIGNGVSSSIKSIVFSGYANKSYDNQYSLINTLLISEDVFTNDEANRKIICNKRGTYSFNIFFTNNNTNSSTMTVYKNDTILETFTIDGMISVIVKTYNTTLEVGDYVQIFKTQPGKGTPTSILVYEV